MLFISLYVQTYSVTPRDNTSWAAHTLSREFGSVYPEKQPTQKRGQVLTFSRGLLNITNSTLNLPYRNFHFINHLLSQPHLLTFCFAQIHHHVARRSVWWLALRRTLWCFVVQWRRFYQPCACWQDSLSYLWNFFECGLWTWLWCYVLKCCVNLLDHILWVPLFCRCKIHWLMERGLDHFPLLIYEKILSLHTALNVFLCTVKL